jgi:hypothetical protein
MECIFKWFGDPGKVAFADTVISVGSIVVAIIALTISCKTQKQLLKIENRRERDRLYEKKKAYLRACGVKEMHEHGSCFYIHIENISMAEARNLEIFYDEEGKRLWDHPALIRGAVKKEMKLIGPKSSIRYLLTEERGGVVYPTKILVTWTDDSGEEGKYSTDITYL